MNKRIFSIRKALKLSQEKFGEKLGVTGAGISKIESSDRNVTEQMMKSVCRTFEVNEEWLRDGKGEMFVQFNDKYKAALGKLLASEDEFIKNMFIGIANMNQQEKNILKEAIKIIKKSNIL